MTRASRIARGQSATVASPLIDAILQAAAAAGVADSAGVDVLRAGVSERSAGVQSSGRTSEAALLWLWGELAQLAGDHRVGAELARFAGQKATASAEPTPFGVFAEVTAGAASLADAFERVVRFARLLHQGVSVEIDTDDRCFTVTYRHAGSDSNPSREAVGAGMLWANSNLALLPERAFGVRLRPVSAELACAVVDDDDGVLADVFGPHVTFETTAWRLIFDRSAVLGVSRQVASSTLAYLDAYADGALSDIPPVEDIVSLVAAEVRRRLAGRSPTVAEVAKALGLSTRTLQRRLGVAGETFAAVLDEIRRGRAKVLLADAGQDLAAIAHELGYSQASAFTRAAVRWFHAPPSRMRCAGARKTR
jgi:AraC-like DNA-binding protein